MFLTVSAVNIGRCSQYPALLAPLPIPGCFLALKRQLLKAMPFPRVHSFLTVFEVLG